MRSSSWLRLSLVVVLQSIPTARAHAASEVRTQAGLVEGTTSADGKVRVFKGIPFAAPPVGLLRWKAPQPAVPWKSVRSATAFGPRCVQSKVYADHVFVDAGPSEDCLTLNVWTPATKPSQRLPVMVWIDGGGFDGGGSSEPRHDGEALARKGVVVVTFNYRLGVFGFLAHPELSKESGRGTSGNYALLDQIAALKWVKANIGVFGGDPGRVTIFGESAGAYSVCFLMASPLAQGLFHRAIGESGGALFSQTDPFVEQSAPARTEEAGVAFAKALGADSLAEMRAKSTESVLAAATKPTRMRFLPTVDGWVLPTNAQANLAVMTEAFAAGRQSHVPLLAGWNSEEGEVEDVMGKFKPTAQNYADLIHKQYGEHADALLKLYPAGNESQTRRTILDLAGDQFIGFSTWKWIDLHSRTGGAPAYRYLFEEAPPADPARPWAKGAFHSAEIEFVFGNLRTRKLRWRPEAYKLSERMVSYWTNFAKTGDPNGPGLPRWPRYEEKSGYQVMHLGAEPGAAPDPHRTRYEFLDTLPPPKQ